MIPYIILIGIMISDIITTEFGIRKQGARLREGNPIMRNPKVRAILELLQLPIPIYIYYVRKISGAKWFDIIIYFLITFRGIIVGNNLGVILLEAKNIDLEARIASLEAAK